MECLPSNILALSLDSAELELSYVKSKHGIELLAKDEDLRRLRAELALVEDDVEELRDQLHHEQEASAKIKGLVDQHIVRAQAAESALESMECKCRRQEHEAEQLRAELQSMKDTTQDTSAIVKEKLALARELSVLRPELLHLRAQDGIAEQLRGEKLALQRELADARCEIEFAKGDAKRAQAKRRNTTMEIAQEEQVADLRKELARERRLRGNAEELAKQAQSGVEVGETKRDLLEERKLRQRLEQDIEDMRGSDVIEEVRRELTKAQKAKSRLQGELDRMQAQLEEQQRIPEQANADDAALAQVKSQLECEKTIRLEVEKSAKDREEQLEQEKAHLEDKLNQFRTKLREKKEELKTTKESLDIIKANAEASAKVVADLAPVKELIKKTAATKNVVPTKPAGDETSLGTPGDGPKKRGRQTKAAAVGEKSVFSITPFLNKTAVLTVEQENSPMLDTSPTTGKQSRVPLSPAASIKCNSEPGKQMETIEKLAAVVEEEETTSQQALQDLDAQVVTNAQLAVPSNTGTKRKQKSRKSLTDFKSFQKADEPVKQKKRQLGLAPMLFDEDDAVGDIKNTSSLFGPSVYAKLATAKKITGGRASALGKSTLLTATDGGGFQFSPLKRTRRKLDDTLRG